MPQEANIDTLNIKVSASSKSASTNIEALADSLSVLKDALKNDGTKSLEKLSNAIATLGNAKKSLQTLGASVRSLAKAMDTAAGAANRYTNALMDTTQMAVTCAGQMRDIGPTILPSHIDEQTAAMTKLTIAISELVTNLPSATAEEEKSAEKASKATKESKGLANAIKLIGDHASKAQNPLKKLFQSIGRIAFYRAIRTAIKNLTAATKEGLTNLKTYSETVGTAYAKAVASLKQHTNLLKNAFATTLRPIIEAIIPLVIQLCDWLARLADFMAQVFSVLTGKVDENGRYTKAILTDLEESTEQAKELKRTLLGFDEINRLDGDTGSSSGTSSGLQFEQAEVSEKARETAEKIAKWLEKIKEIINSIDWATVLKVIAAIWGIVTGIKLISKLVQVAKFIGKIASVLGGKSAGIIGALVAIVTWFAIDGENISKTLDKWKEKTNAWFDSLKPKSETGNALKDFAKDAYNNISDFVSNSASAIYKLFHGDFQGALDDGLAALKSFAKLLAGIVIGVVNIVLGIFSDLVNLIAKGITWIHNKVFAPFVNTIYTAIENVKIWVHNAVLDVRIFFLELVSWILGKAEEVLQGILGTVNSTIEAINNTFGTNLKPIEFHINSTAVDSKIAELESKKLPPITETVEIVGQWTEPKALKLQVETAGVYSAIDGIGRKSNEVLSTLSKISNFGGGGGGRASYMTLYAQGGYPPVGTMFIAGEAGPEYVGDIGGRTGVMNIEQMAAAMYKAMTPHLRTIRKTAVGTFTLTAKSFIGTLYGATTTA